MKRVLTILLIIPLDLQWLILWTLLTLSSILVDLHQVTDNRASVLLNVALQMLTVRHNRRCWAFMMLGKRRWKCLSESSHILVWL